MTIQTQKPVVLDTNVVVYIINSDLRAAYYEEQIKDCRLFISFQTLEELWFRAVNNRWGDRRRTELSRHIELYEVLWPNDEIVSICANLRSERQKAGRSLNAADAWIAATAIFLNCPLASHDRDFSNIPNLTLIQQT